MKVRLTGQREEQDCIIFGVKFVNGVAELTQEEVDAKVFERLLSRYHPVEKVTGEGAPTSQNQSGNSDNQGAQASTGEELKFNDFEDQADSIVKAIDNLTEEDLKNDGTPKKAILTQIAKDHNVDPERIYSLLNMVE